MYDSARPSAPSARQNARWTNAATRPRARGAGRVRRRESRAPAASAVARISMRVSQLESCGQSGPV